MKRALSKREREVLKLLLLEYTQKEIGYKLNLTSSSVSTYKNNIMEKWEVKSLVGLTVEAIKSGDLDLWRKMFLEE
jgi:DNA-binding NarL/FixJ family response regulator